MKQLLVKICGLQMQRDVDMLDEKLVQLCGFIFYDKSPRNVSLETVRAIRTYRMKRVGVFVNQDADQINRVMDECRLDYAQLHGNQTVKDALTIGASRVIRVLWPMRYCDREALEKTMDEYVENSAYFLMDAATSSGGSGQTIKWKDLHGLCSKRQWFLAGGLTCENLEDAIDEYSPDGVDINSGVESMDSSGHPFKDIEKVQKTMCLLRGMQR